MAETAANPSRGAAPSAPSGFSSTGAMVIAVLLAFAGACVCVWRLVSRRRRRRVFFFFLFFFVPPFSPLFSYPQHQPPHCSLSSFEHETLALTGSSPLPPTRIHPFAGADVFSTFKTAENESATVRFNEEASEIPLSSLSPPLSPFYFSPFSSCAQPPHTTRTTRLRTRK